MYDVTYISPDLEFGAGGAGAVLISNKYPLSGSHLHVIAPTIREFGFDADAVVDVFTTGSVRVGLDHIIHMGS